MPPVVSSSSKALLARLLSGRTRALDRRNGLGFSYPSPPMSLGKLGRLPQARFIRSFACIGNQSIGSRKVGPSIGSWHHKSQTRWFSGVVDGEEGDRLSNTYEETPVVGSILPEDEFHKLADETLHDLLEKFEEYGDEVQIDDFDVDYGNHVLTLKLGNLGTYVMNKQTPNRQIWLSSPVRFDWDEKSNQWIYRRTKANLLQLLEEEVVQLCGKPLSLS